MLKNRKQLIVPDDVRYLSLWDNLWEELPDEHFILNKKLTNVGATFYFLENDQKTILCSPRCSLLESKKGKHPNAWIYRSMSDETSSDSEKAKRPKKATPDDIRRYNEDVVKYLGFCITKGIVPKIMTTYDSLGHIIDVLNSMGGTNGWTLVVDEYQSIFSDAAYKATTELNFLYNAQFFKQAVFLSATPYLEEYMEEMPEFKDMKYVELVWPADMQTLASVSNITLGKRESIPVTAKKIIDCMRARKTVKFGTKEINTTEAVFYINKVSTIRDIIKKCDLKPSEVNILCAKSDANDNKLKEVGHARGDFPKPGEKNKMFTFCTRSSFLGVDLESDCAYSYVFADPSQKTLALDISTDLSQILGRQRLDCNPYQHEAILFIKENSIGLDDAEFQKYIESKKHTTEMLIKNYEDADESMKAILVKKYRRAAERDHYCDDYLCVRDDRKTGKPVVEFNMLVMLSEIRAWEIRKKNYTSQYQVIKEQEKTGIRGISGTKTTNPDILSFKTQYEAARNSTVRIKTYSEFRHNHPDLVPELDFIPHRLSSYWDALGYEAMKTLGFQESKIRAVLAVPSPFDNTLDNVILQLRVKIKEEKYTCSDIKGHLEKIYKKAGLKKSAVAKDIGLYLTTKPYQDSKTGKKYIEVLSLYQKSITLFPFVWRPNVPVTKGMTIDRLLDIIETGKYKITKSLTETRNLKDVILEIRSLSRHDEQGKLKRDWLPVACFSGVFKYKDDHGLVIYSSFLALDYDGFEDKEKMTKAKDKLKTYPFVYAIFETPSGSGLKAIVLHDSTNPVFHYNLYQQVLKVCGLPQTDYSTSDLSRGHFLSYDPTLWRNSSPEPFHFEYDCNIVEPKKQENKTVVTGNGGGLTRLDTWESEFLHELWQNILTDDAIIKRLENYWTTKKTEYFEVGKRHSSMLIMAGTLCKAGIPRDKTFELLQRLYQEKEKNEIESIIDFAFGRNAFGGDRRKYK